ncbi:uncharacterized protein LOC18441396 isoform X2 [Amborella trichopoda]|uniref:uncharacterized protein LOC18441396 isoform X2 n=1 Tax=Amborella trichopoda TaxID=13333 RepID=UPI0009C0EB24|nr:uncharacterized protein LOC18441396 isoform X2 [Amborella trichopoda]|eukprot:XP_006851627.2 uncharacterized protein LOC18441396 isoform X2 [Amborella trichopoda]
MSKTQFTLSLLLLTIFTSSLSSSSSKPTNFISPTSLNSKDQIPTNQKQENANPSHSNNTKLVSIPDHIPRLCDECRKPNGNCGIGLRCLCYPSQCKQSVLSGGAAVKPVDALFVVVFCIFCEISQYKGRIDCKFKSTRVLSCRQKL